MAVATAIPIETYLRTSFVDLDREFRDGELVERSMPDYLHGKTQALLCVFFMALRKSLSLFPCVETRMRMRSGRTLIPDVAVFYPTEPSRIPDTPPLLAIEVLSLDDPLAEVRAKLEEYRTWGVPHVWLVDPHAQRLYDANANGPGRLGEVDLLEIPELSIRLTAADAFD